MAKEFTQREGINYTKTFSLVSRKDSLRVIMALVAHFDLEHDECKTHLCFEFISNAILSILYPYSCKTHKISSKLGFSGFFMESK